MGEADHEQGYLKYLSEVTHNRFLWGSLIATVDYLVLYTNNPSHGFETSRRVGSIPLEVCIDHFNLNDTTRELKLR